MNFDHYLKLQKSGNLISAEKGYKLFIKQNNIVNNLFASLGLIYLKTNRVKTASKFFNKELEVLIDIGEITKETPAKLSQRLKQECHREMISDFEKDKNVQQLLKHFSGTLAKETIAPTTDQDN